MVESKSRNYVEKKVRFDVPYSEVTPDSSLEGEHEIVFTEEDEDSTNYSIIDWDILSNPGSVMSSNST